MKLLLISAKSASPIGGIAVWTEHFLSYCQQHNFVCHLVNTEIVGNRTMTQKRNVRDEWVRTRCIFRKLRKQLKTNSFDAVYLNTSCGTFGLFRDVYLAHLVFKKGIPLITHYHCEIPYWVKKKISIRALNRLAQMSKHNLVLCQNSQLFMKEQFGITAKKVPNFVSTSLVRTIPKAIEGPVKQVVFVGNITEHKGATELYHLAQKLPEIHFTLIGKVKSTVATWPKPDNITLTGTTTQEKVIQLLDAADVFLFPSHTEGCPIALMEAMARGLPSIATDTGANAEMLEDGCGIVVNRHDCDAMLHALHKLNDPNLRRAMSVQATQKIAQQYTEQNIHDLMNLVESHSTN